MFDFRWLIPALALFVTAIFGIFFALGGWISFTRSAPGSPEKRARNPLLAHSASVILVVATIAIIYMYSDYGGYVFNMPFTQFVTAVNLPTSMVILVIALRLTGSNADTASRIVRWGSVYCLAIDGVAWILFALYGYST